MSPTSLQQSGSALSAGSTASKTNITSADQKEIETIWKEVNSKVLELAGGQNVKKNLDIDEVMQLVDSVKDANEKKAEKHGRLKRAVHKTLQCISTVGGIVADGASNVFAPAGMCYNALTFVIQAWQGYEEMFENLAELLEKCVEFLERLESYRANMDSKLTRLACQNLRLFTEICDRTIKLSKKHKRFIAITKQLFLNDDGIQEILAMMERLNSKENLLVNAQTYRIVSDSAGDIKLMLDAQKEQRKEDEAKKWRRTIAKALGFPGTSLDTDGEPIPRWQRAYETRLNALVSETGTWFLEDRTCREWTSAPSPPRQTLALMGKSGSGKTSMMANTIKTIRLLGEPRVTPRLATAYYFTDGDKRKVEDEDESSLLQRVSRTLLWQIATAYEAMTKSVYNLVERPSRFNGALDLWQKLFLDNKERLNSDTTFYLFIDSYHEELEGLLQKLSAAPANHKTRVFITARPELFDKTLHRIHSFSFDTVHISELNGEDVNKYINFRMDKMPILGDINRPGILDWRQRICKTLLKLDGDYFRLNWSLNALAKVDLTEDILAVLRGAERTRVDQIDNERQRLNNSRTVKEIQEINEIILWIDYGKQYFPVETLEAILSVKHRAGSSMAAVQPSTAENADDTNGSASLTISLLPFEQRLAEKYPIFTVTDSGVVDWKSQEIKTRIPRRVAQRESLRDPHQHSSVASHPVIEKAEIEIVSHFLNTVCPPGLYQKFRFDKFFDDLETSVKQTDEISLDPDNANIKLSLSCLVILTDKGLRSNDKLRHYATYWLLDHLEAVDLSVADRDLKAQVGPLLVKLFTEECGIDSLFWCFDKNVSMKTWNLGEYSYLREARIEWLYSTAGVQQIYRWFQDTSVTRNITTERGISLVAAVKNRKANLHESLLSFAAKHLADHLYRRSEFLPRQFLSACCFLRGYLSRMDPARATQMPDGSTEFGPVHSIRYEGREFSLAELKEIEDWAARTLNKLKDTRAEESQWEIHGALITFQLCHEEGVAEIYLNRARTAITLDANNLHACHFIAKRPTTSNEEAIELLGRAMKAIDGERATREALQGDRTSSSLLARITLDLGDRLWNLGEDYVLAAQTHRESLSYDYVHFNTYSDILEEYANRQQWNELISFIETLNEKSDIWSPYFDELVNEFILEMMARDSYLLAEAAEITSRWDVIEAFFTLAVDIGAKQEAYDLLFILREGFARTLASASNDNHQDKVILTRETALKEIKIHPSDTLSKATIEEVIDALALAYLDRAFLPGTSIETTESYGSLIAGLLPDISGVCDIWINTIAVCCFIRYHAKNRSDAKLAKVWVQQILQTGLELLSDDDEENDDAAYYILARLLTTLGDEENTRITWTMRSLIQYELQKKWDKWAVWDKPVITHSSNSSDISSKKDDGDTEIDGLAARFRSTTPASIERSRQSSRGRTRDSSIVSQPVELYKDNLYMPGEPIAPTLPLTNGSRKSQSIRSSSSDRSDGTPDKPETIVICDGCNKQWVTIDEPFYACCDDVGTVHLDERCYSRFMKDELKLKRVRCNKNHSFIRIPMSDKSLFDIMPRRSLPLPDAPADGRAQRWISLDEWKDRLRALYLGDIEPKK